MDATSANPEAWVEIDRFFARADAEPYALVLAAAGISCRIEVQPDATTLWVAPGDARRARHEVASYARENQRRHAPPRLRALTEGIECALAWCAVLLFLYGASRRDLLGLHWWYAGAAQSGLITGGEWWRTVTALGLHVDLGHLASNLAFGAILGLLLGQLLGAGLAWLMILLGGAGGNALSAWLHSASHSAVGASTAVFAAVGMLAALTWRQREPQWPHGLRRWLPLAAGVMLLAFMGFGGERTDIGGHVAGFAAGVALGAGLAYGGKRIPQGRRAQWAYGLTALALLTLAWVVGLWVDG
jgi:membrane associated rhomboid family serine protease